MSVATLDISSVTFLRRIGLFIDRVEPWRPSIIPPGDYLWWIRDQEWDAYLTIDGALHIRHNGEEVHGFAAEELLCS